MSSPEAVVNFGSMEAWTRVGGLLAGALRRHRVRLAALALLFMSVGAAAAVLLPRSYSAQSRLLVKKNYVMPALASPRRAVPTGSETLTQSAAEFVLSRQSLKDLVTRANLLERWDRERPAALAFKDHLVTRVQGPMSADDKTEALIDLLASRIRVTVEDEVVRVRATWSDPRTVVDIVNGAVAEFLEARRRIDVQAIADTSMILAKAADEERAKVEAQLEVVGLVRLQLPRPRLDRPRGERTDPAVEPTPVAAPDPLEGLRSQIAEARKVRLTLEKQHADEIEQVRARLAARRAVLTERHPEIQAIRRTLDRVSAEPAALTDARAQEASLVATYTEQGGDPTATPGDGEAPSRMHAAPAVHAEGQSASPLPSRGDAAPLIVSTGPEEEDDALAYQRAMLKSLMANYQDLQSRLANVQVELQTAKAAFPYRYSVTAPARVPKKPDSPNALLIVIGALVAGCAAGIVSAVLSDLRSRSLTSPAAIRRFLAAEAA